MEPFENDYHPYHDPSFAWEDLAWLKEQAGGVPIYLKGVCRADVSGRYAAVMSLTTTSCRTCGEHGSTDLPV